MRQSLVHRTRNGQDREEDRIASRDHERDMAVRRGLGSEAEHPDPGDEWVEKCAVEDRQNKVEGEVFMPAFIG
jgi:hypothetical protein